MKNNIKETELQENIKQVLLGSLLGDGYLTKQKNSHNAYFREVHSLKQKDYLIWKNNFLNYFNTKIKEYSTYDKRTNKYYYSIYLYSRVNPAFTTYHNSLYKQNIKKVTKEFLNEIKKLGLSVWYMDDGYYHYGYNRVGLATDCYSYKEHVLIKNWLKCKFDIKSQIHRRNKIGENSYNIVLSKNEATKFLKIIEPYIIKSMYYKLGHLKSENLQKINKHKGRALQMSRKYYHKIKETKKYKKYRKNYVQINKKKLLENRKRYYLINKDKILKLKKEYYIKNRNSIREKQNLYRLKKLMIERR
tara:strand:- start:2195 stop:3103 length:909 start_codon:yes stop_codon:yes gene_type:complete